MVAVLFVFVIIGLFITFLILYIQGQNSQDDQNRTNNKNSDRNTERNTGMVTVAMQGGLGNQLFQVAAAYTFAKNHNKTFVLDHSIKMLNVGKPRRTYFETIYKFVENTPVSKHNWGIVKGPDYEYKDLTNLPGNVQLEGYFQSDKYLTQEIVDLFLQHITTVDNTSTSLIAIRSSVLPTVSLHIRRTDYVGHTLHTNLGLDYYNQAYEKLGNVNVIVFSDDINWCKTNLPKHWSILHFVDEGLTDEQELWLMSQCTHHIIANSSFSWWGARLGKTNGTTIAPLKWLNSESANWQDVYCENWVRI